MTQLPTMHQSDTPRLRPQTWLRVGGWILFTLVLLLVFLLYTRSDFLVNMANQLWSCF